MELSIFLANIIAIVYLAAGVGVLSSKISLAKVVDDFEKSPGLTMLAGMFGVIIGMLLVEYHNFWVKDWTVLITIIGWLALLKGIMLIAFPQMISEFKPWYKNSQGWGILMLVVGLVFGYFGFIA